MNRKLIPLIIGLLIGGAVMAQVPIVGLPPATLPLTGNETVVLVQNKVTKQAPVSAFDTLGTVTSLTAGAGITLTPSPITSTGAISLTAPVTVPLGGTGLTSLTGLALGNGTSAMSAYSGTTCGANTALVSLDVNGAGTCAASGGTPGGGAFTVQYNNAGVFAGIPVGTANQVLTSNGPGVPATFQPLAATTPAGADTQIQYNNAGAFGASAKFSWTDSTSLLSIGTQASPATISPVVNTANGGTLNVRGGTTTNGNGGTLNLVGGAGVGTNRAGGAVNLTAGARTGAGSLGAITLTSGTDTLQVNGSGDIAVGTNASALAGFSVTNAMNSTSAASQFEALNSAGDSAEFGMTSPLYSSGVSPNINGATGLYAWIATFSLGNFYMASGFDGGGFATPFAWADQNQNFLQDTLVAHTTTDTNGFFYLGCTPGAPTGVPANVTGSYAHSVAMRYDCTGNNLYAYNGSWHNLSGGGGGGTPANPTALVGLTAVNGTATTYMRSDASPPIDQSISPTWTGFHTFTAGTEIDAPTGVTGLDMTAGDTVALMTLQAGPTTDFSFGINLNAGTSFNDYALDIKDTTGAKEYFRVGGDGSVTVGDSSQSGIFTVLGTMQIAPLGAGPPLQVTTCSGCGLIARFDGDASGSGGVTINSGLTSGQSSFAVNNVNTSTHYFEVFGDGGVTVGSPTGSDQGIGTVNATGLFINGVAVGAGSSPANPTASVGLTAVNGSASTFLRSDGAPALSQAISPSWSGSHLFTKSASGATLTTYPIAASSAVPAYGLLNPTAGTDLKIWDWVSDASGQMAWRTLNDSVSVARDIFRVFRSGVAVTGITFGNATDNPNFSFLGTGNLQAGNAAGTATQQVISLSGGTGAAQLVANSSGTEALVMMVNATAAPISGIPAGQTGVFNVAGRDFYVGIGTVPKIRQTASATSAWGPSASGLVDLTPDTTVFTGTFTGMTTGVTGSVRVSRTGNIAVMLIPAISGTAAANTFTMTGIPSGFIPAGTQMVSLGAYSIMQNSTGANSYAAQFTASSGTLTFLVAGAADFSSTGFNATAVPRAIPRVIAISYLLN